MSDDDLRIKQCALDQVACDLPYTEVTDVEITDTSMVRRMMNEDAVAHIDEPPPDNRWYVVLKVTCEDLASTALYRVWRSEAGLQATLIILKAI